MNWVEHFMTSDLDECPHIVRESDGNDYILEIVRAMKFAGQKGKKFSRKVDDKISKYGEMIALPNGKTISDVTLSINSKDLSFDINEDNIYESPEIREWTGKNNVMLGFGKKDGDKYPLEITCNWDCVKDLKEYIINRTYNPDEIVIYITRTNTGEHSTTGTLVTDDGTISGYTVELPRGTDEECKTACPETSSKPYDCYCIIEGTYNFQVTTYSKNANYVNKSLRIISAIPNNRVGILVHKGQDDAKGWARGCILPMPKKPADNLSYDDRFKKDSHGQMLRQNNASESEDFVISIVEWVKQRETEILSRNTNLNIKSIPHKIVITKTFEQ
jgi:hypothetical protein